MQAPSELSVLWDAGGERDKNKNDTHDYYWITKMQHTNLPMHVTCPVIMIQQFMLYDLSWIFCFTIYDYYGIS